MTGDVRAAADSSGDLLNPLHNVRTVAVSPAQPQPETTDFIYEATAASRERQIQAAQAHDTKATAAFAAATVVVGLAAASSFVGHAATVLVALAIVAYIVAAGAAVICLLSRPFSVEVSPGYLWRRFWNSNVQNIKHAIIDERGKGYTENVGLLREKTRALRFTLLATGAETVLVGLALLASRLG